MVRVLLDLKSNDIWSPGNLNYTESTVRNLVVVKIVLLCVFQLSSDWDPVNRFLPGTDRPHHPHQSHHILFHPIPPVGSSERQHRPEQIAESDGPPAPCVRHPHPHGPDMGVRVRLSDHACASRVLLPVLHLQRVSRFRYFHLLLRRAEARAFAMVRVLHV